MPNGIQDLETYHKRARMLITFLTEYLECLLDLFIRNNEVNLVGPRRAFVPLLLKKFNKLKEHFEVNYKRMGREYSIWGIWKGDTYLDIVQIVYPFPDSRISSFRIWTITILFSFSNPECKFFYDRQKNRFLPSWTDATRHTAEVTPNNEEVIGLSFRIFYTTSFMSRYSFTDTGNFKYRFYNNGSWDVKNTGFKHWVTTVDHLYQIDETLFLNPLLFKGQLLAAISDSWKSAWLASDQLTI